MVRESLLTTSWTQTVKAQLGSQERQLVSGQVDPPPHGPGTVADVGLAA